MEEKIKPINNEIKRIVLEHFKENYCKTSFVLYSKFNTKSRKKIKKMKHKTKKKY